ncbi:TRAP transporter small permease subunit [Allopusillimonas soli]|uniref:TRAP transporter small permease protein n=1 Tax=Allopusillimonas soli TaxID=659016 RepID=A0A853FIV0_9BURK|nr:TRAP transporter small permease subunit [Allopusillimonas soli]NYT38670.1 TRAP transporter small permease subunit [Allopusillimonas soli]TEA71624.1 TRAP transporter small permease subunit [Allopusillimonas soli]
MITNESPGSGRVVPALTAACRVFEWLAIIMLLLTTFLVVLQVVARNAFQAGLPWADELARYGGLGIVYLAVPLLLLRGGHIAVDIVSGRLRGRARHIIFVLNEAITLAFCGFFLAGGYLFLVKAGKFATPALRMPNLIFYLPAMLGMVLFTLVAILRLHRAIAQRALTDEQPGGQPS